MDAYTIELMATEQNRDLLADADRRRLLRAGRDSGSADGQTAATHFTNSKRLSRTSILPAAMPSLVRRLARVASGS